MILKWVTGWSFLLSSKLTSLLIPAPIWPFRVCLHLCILFYFLLKLIDATVFLASIMIVENKGKQDLRQNLTWFNLMANMHCWHEIISCLAVFC